MAYDHSGCDKRFVLMIEGENGRWDIKRESMLVGKNGHRDYGLCQINKGYHGKIVNDKNFYNTQFQIEKCYELYSSGTRFYGMDRIKKIKGNIIFL